MSKGDKSDLTRLEDLAHFEHLEDPEIDLLLAPPRQEAEEGQGISLDQLNDELPEIPQEETQEEVTSELSSAFTSEDDASLPSELPELPQEDFSLPVEESASESPSEEISFTTPEEPSPQVENQEFEPQFSQPGPQKEEETSSPSLEESLEFSQETPQINERPPHTFSSQISQPETPRKKAEDFQDVKTFAQNISYGKVTTGGNPPFSVMLRNIRAQEDGEEILSLLDEHGLLTPDSEEIIKTGIKHGAVLISQISEYSAIYLAHKLRRFNLDVLVGLSEELHQSKSYESSERGLVSKDNILQNHSDHLDLDETPVALENIIVTTTPTLPGYKVCRYVEVITEQTFLEEQELTQANSDLEQTQVYSELVDKLKNKALKLNCNGILGVNYQFLPVPSSHNQTRYKVICTGNAVVLSDS